MPDFAMPPPIAPPAAPPAALGILMLDTSFHRPPGDAGNPASWPFPVLIERVHGACARPVVNGDVADAQPFIAAGQRLVERGAVAITTTCGFLARMQNALAEALPVPVMTSALLAYRAFAARIGHSRRVAILTIDASALDANVRRAAGISADAPVFALAPESHFVRAILDAAIPLDRQRAEAEWVQLATSLQQRDPDLGGWLFECANMPPYAAAVRRATGLPVYDALSLGRELYERATQWPPTTR